MPSFSGGLFQQIGARVCSGIFCVNDVLIRNIFSSPCAWQQHKLKVNTHEPNIYMYIYTYIYIYIYDFKWSTDKQSQTHRKHTTRSTSTHKLILWWNTTFRAQVKHTVTLRERKFAGILVTDEVQTWLSNYIPLKTMDVIIFPCCHLR